VAESNRRASSWFCGEGEKEKASKTEKGVKSPDLKSCLGKGGGGGGWGGGEEELVAGDNCTGCVGLQKRIEHGSSHSVLFLRFREERRGRGECRIRGCQKKKKKTPQKPKKLENLKNGIDR